MAFVTHAYAASSLAFCHSPGGTSTAYGFSIPGDLLFITGQFLLTASTVSRLGVLYLMPSFTNYRRVCSTAAFYRCGTA